MSICMQFVKCMIFKMFKEKTAIPQISLNKIVAKQLKNHKHLMAYNNIKRNIIWKDKTQNKIPTPHTIKHTFPCIV